MPAKRPDLAGWTASKDGVRGPTMDQFRGEPFGGEGLLGARVVRERRREAGTRCGDGSSRTVGLARVVAVRGGERAALEGQRQGRVHGGASRSDMPRSARCRCRHRHPGVQPTNNHAERALRSAVIYGKLSPGSQSDAGEQRVAPLLSAHTTCRLRRRPAARRRHRRHHRRQPRRPSAPARLSRGTERS